MSRSVSVTPQAPQALRGDQIEKQFLWDRGQRLKIIVKRGQPSNIRGVRLPGGQGTRGAQGLKGNNQGEMGKSQNWVLGGGWELDHEGLEAWKGCGVRERLVRGQRTWGSEVRVSPHLAGSAVRPSGQRGTPGHPWGQQGGRRGGPGA